MKMVKLYKGLLCLYIALCLVFTGGLTALSADAQVQNESAGLTDVVYDFTKGMTEGEDVMLLTEYDETGIKNINWKYKNKIQASYTIIFYQDTMRVNGSNIHADRTHSMSCIPSQKSSRSCIPTAIRSVCETELRFLI